jgi:hypothetical protein
MKKYVDRIVKRKVLDYNKGYVIREFAESFIGKFDTGLPEEWFYKPALPASETVKNNQRFADFYDEEVTYPKRLKDSQQFFDQKESFWKDNLFRQ